MKKIYSYNINGIRAAIKKGFYEWVALEQPDILCLQETKALQTDVNEDFIKELGYHTYWFSAQKRGYSGVAVYTKILPKQVIYGTGHAQSDSEGRVLQLLFDDFLLINAYFPSGTSGEERQNYKYQWLGEMSTFLDTAIKKQPCIMLLGDYNIAHQEIDIHDPKGNKNSSGFLPAERQWMTDFLAGQSMVDSYRFINPTTQDAYSWWSQRFPSVRLQNKGWRIDYICITKPLLQYLTSASIHADIKHSDHCPVSMILTLP
ncbi:MAG: exodeoxyribonuclease III [Phycisphaerales bacterium]|nr:exodeoxyribonuclease III [Phycisphaerales bacterium]